MPKKRSRRLLSSGFKTQVLRYTPNGEAKRIQPVYIDFTPTEKQRELIQNTAFECFFGGAAGGGKGGLVPCARWAFQNLKSFTGFTKENYDEIMSLIPQEVKDMETKVLMWDGSWKELSAIEIGDRLINPDGQSQEVDNIHQIRELECYEITFEDGTKVQCDENHLWGFWQARANSRRKTCGGKKPVLDTSNPQNWNFNYISRARVRNIKYLYERVNKGTRIIIPISAPLNFTALSRGNKERAYLYGALIGDGCIQNRRFGAGISLCSADRHIIERCTALCSEYKENKPKKYKKDFWVVFLRDRWVDQWARNSGLLNKKSYEKFLPKGYLKESLQFRWALAQGLFDTDGYASNGERNEVSYCTTSSQLAEDVANLVRTLGFMAKVKSKQGIAYKDGVGKEGRMAYIVYVEGNNRWRLFSLPRKVEAAKKQEPNIWVGKAIQSIEKIEKEWARCITVSNPNGLYITDGYNVTHNSYSLVMTALCYHEKAIIFRREYPQLKELIAVAKKATWQKGKYNQRDKIITLNDGRFLEFGGLQYEDDKENYQGRPHDFLGFDEITHMTKSQYEYLRGWARTENPNQRVRIICTGNPPTSAQGQWVREHWGAWLDQNHTNPADQGEIRYYARLGDEEVEVDSPEPILHKGETITPVSRTFIRSMVEDNPYYMATGYRETLLSLPAPLRDKLLYGDFSGAMDENYYQLIPTTWFEWSVNNYKRNTNSDPLPLTQIGVDCARGGQDKTVLALRYGGKEFGRKRFELVKIPGRETPDGQSIVQHIMKYHQAGVKVNIDVIGIGASAYDKAREYISRDVAPVNFSVVSQDRDRTGRLEFINIRAEFYWRLREQLDYENSPIQIELPPDKELRRDALSIQWGLGLRGVKIESKDELIARTGASPDCMDAIVYADAEGRAKKKPSQSKYKH